MNIGTLLLYLYPQLKPLQDYTVQDNGTGEYIASWTAPSPQPTLEDLKAQESNVQTQYDQIQLSIKNQPILNKLNTVDLKTIRALRENDFIRIKQLNDEAIQLRQGLVK